jgi:UDP-N-acetyl-D-mannosaminuronic acid transferase (WecB/TagA/CpsF family)
MGQRVNISYSIDIEELPQAVTTLITKAQAELETLTAANKEWGIEFLSMETLAKITTLRETMSRADYILNDVSNIINGYIHYQTQPAPTAAPTTDLATDMDGLEAKLAQFKNAFGQPGSDEVTD